MNRNKRVLVFGSTGAIGSAICQWFGARHWTVLAATRRIRSDDGLQENIKCFTYDPFENCETLASSVGEPVHAIVWAQGQNTNDDIYSVELERHVEMYRSNVLYIVASLQSLVQNRLLVTPARLCVISSIWQNIARQNKLSYTVTKSALQGLVQSLAIDLGREQHLVNAVLPGALDTPMTRKNLTPEQITELERLTPLGRLAALEDVCNLVGYLCSESNTGVTGQFINVDGGFSHARIL